MKRFLLVLVSVLMIITLVACSSGNDLIGSWKAENNEELEALGLDLTFTFTEDEMSMMDIAFPYKLDGNKILISMDGQEEVIYFKVNGNELILTVDGEEQVFMKVEE